MKIRLRKVKGIFEKFEPTESYISINCLSWFENNVLKLSDDTIPIYQVSPYHLKNENGHIFENLYQSQKIYKIVHEQDQPSNRGGWKWPRQIHIDDNEMITNEYWQWRHSLQTHPFPVRYPNGFHGRKECKGSLVINGDTIELFDYISSRKRYYVEEYSKLVVKTEAFQKLKQINVNMEFMEIDCPVPGIEVTKETYEEYIENSSLAFGHSWVLAKLLLGLGKID